MDNGYLFTSSNTIYVNKRIIDFMNGDCVSLLVLYAYIDSYKYYYNEGKLQDDDTFYTSNTKVSEFLKISTRKLIRSKNKLISMNLLSSLQKKIGEASYIKLNHKLLKKIYGYEEKEEQETKIIRIEKAVKTKQKKSDEIALATKLWNEKIADKYMLIKKIQGITGTRESNFRTRLKESKLSVEEFFDNLEKHIASSDFLQGVSERDWVVSFSWAMKPDNYLKIVEDNYRNITREERGKAIDEAIFRNWKD